MTVMNSAIAKDEEFSKYPTANTWSTYNTNKFECESSCFKLWTFCRENLLKFNLSFDIHEIIECL